MPIPFLLRSGSAPRFLARSPFSGVSIFMTSAPRFTNWYVQKGPAKTLVKSSIVFPSSGFISFFG